jgi:hypothetical protein
VEKEEDKIMKRISVILAAVMLVACAALAPAHADTILTDFNSQATIDVVPTTYPGGGVINWSVDNTFIQFQQQYFVGVGPAGVQAPLSSMTYVSATPNIAVGSFIGAGFTAYNTYTLLGGTAGSGTSDIASSFRLINTSGTTQAFRLYLYVDFDLGNVAAIDTATITGNNLATQIGVTFPNWQAVTTLNPNADLVEVNAYPSTINSLMALSLYNLNGATSVGPSDATWAVEYLFSLPADGAFILSVDERVSQVPVPPSVLLMGSGLLGLGLVGWRRRKES